MSQSSQNKRNIGIFVFNNVKVTVALDTAGVLVWCIQLLSAFFVTSTYEYTTDIRASEIVTLKLELNVDTSILLNPVNVNENAPV